MNTWLHHEAKRRDAYKLLSDCYHLPEPQTLKNVAELREALSTTCVQAAEQFASVSGEESRVEQLKVDHARLFVGPFQLLAPPYGSVYLDGKGRRLIGDSTVDVKQRYSQAGLGTGETFKEAPDHIAIELEFLYYLVFKELEAMTNSDVESALRYLATQQSFLRDHLGIWVTEFADAVERNASTGFYRNLAGATRAFVRQDLDSISASSMAGLSALAAAR